VTEPTQLTPAMSKALALHQPQGELPIGYDRGTPEQLEAYRLLNIVRTSLNDDDWPKKVYAFHSLYRVDVGEQGRIQRLSARRQVLRQRLRDEENKETNDALLAGDLVEQIDGCLDLIYVAIGELIELGMTPELINRGMQEVHASNMTKTDENGQPIFDEGGKVLKGDNYVRADLCLALGIDNSPKV